MPEQKYERFSNFLFLVSVFLIVYMPLHVFISQSASLLTGGLEVWKAAKDVLLFLLAPGLLFLAYRRGLFSDKTFRTVAILGAVYALLHGLYLLLDQNDDTVTTIIASVYNTRLLVFLLLGCLVGVSKNGKKYLKYLLTAAVLIASIVALLGVLQYFLPHDLLTHIGYSLERGVKPMFFIDDKPDFPRVMSTLKDPNSLGSYLILPLLLSAYALLNEESNKKLFLRPFRRGVLVAMTGLMLLALILTFSRGAVLALSLSTVTILYIATGDRVGSFLKKHLFWFLLLVTFCTLLFARFWNTYTFQNLVFHADQSTVLADPNELRVSLTQDAVEEIVDEPLGHGPGTAGLVSIRNPQGGILTENYYLQIAYEVGWLGLALFAAILLSVIRYLLSMTRNSPLAKVLFASLIGYLFYSLLIHLWSNEAVALQWFLLAGTVFGFSMKQKN